MYLKDRNQEIPALRYKQSVPFYSTLMRSNRIEIAVCEYRCQLGLFSTLMTQTLGHIWKLTTVPSALISVILSCSVYLKDRTNQEIPALC